MEKKNINTEADLLKTSYSACRRLVQRSGSNFARCLWVLGPPKRRAMEALYAFLRITDDLADQPAPASCRQMALHQWRLALQEALQKAAIPLVANFETEAWVGEEVSSASGLLIENLPPGLSQPLPMASASGPMVSPASGPPVVSHPSGDNLVFPGGGDGLELSEGGGGSSQRAYLEILPALVDTVCQFHIPPAYLYAVLDGVGMDVAGVRYETFEQLAFYCRRVASAVGLACLCIWGAHCPEAAQPAIACGLAFQLTNILRDLKEDARMGRVYLPTQELAASGYSVEDFPPAQADRRFDQFIHQQVERAQRFYRQAATLWDFLDPAGQRIFGMMYETYRKLLERIAQKPSRVLTERVHLIGCEKLTIALRWTLWPARRWL